MASLPEETRSAAPPSSCGRSPKAAKWPRGSISICKPENPPKPAAENDFSQALYFFFVGLQVPAVSRPSYPRSPKTLLGGIAHLARFIDKIRMRNAGLIQDYNYITVGFDKQLIDFLKIDAKAFETRVLAGGSDEDFLAWTQAHGEARTPEDIARWNTILLSSHPKDDAARQRFQGRLHEIAAKRGVPVGALPAVSTWAEVIELDEHR